MNERLEDKFRLDEQGIALRAARELRDGMCVNLGIGIPTMVSNCIPEGRTIIFQSESGVVGYGPITSAEEADWDLVNASAQPVSLVPGTSFLDHAESFAMIRGGHIDVAILGALQVSERGDLANWRVPGKIGGPGGGMDVVSGAKRVIVTFTHTARDGTPKIVRDCTYPITGRRCVDLIITDIAVIEVTPIGLLLREVAPGWTPREVQRLTGAPLQIDPGLKQIEL